MPTFQIIQRRDAVQIYTVEIEAESAEAALLRAVDQPCAWVDGGAFDCDDAEMEVADMDGQTLIPSQRVW